MRIVGRDSTEFFDIERHDRRVEIVLYESSDRSVYLDGPMARRMGEFLLASAAKIDPSGRADATCDRGVACADVNDAHTDNRYEEIVPLRVAIGALDKIAQWDQGDDLTAVDEMYSAKGARAALREIRGGNGRPKKDPQ